MKCAWLVAAGLVVVGTLAACGGGVDSGLDAQGQPKPDVCLFRITTSDGSLLLRVDQPVAQCETTRGQLNSGMVQAGGTAVYADGVSVDSATPTCVRIGIFGQDSKVYPDAGAATAADAFCTGFTGHVPSPSS